MRNESGLLHYEDRTYTRENVYIDLEVLEWLRIQSREENTSISQYMDKVLKKEMKNANHV
ncbi:hypothetical protein D9M68_445820 [compost metagenome]